ncbi:GNAT family N-acetyltransferase [Lacihabitans soyangensis]|uniref:GNAT family N-acetyltransferase n=1 Tax=Lacihabitans soyangensis TaxID=869394 RepID=A0AAE3H575_9BACT|nr:GNAT family N-acetyltransferase [Lacihabitans soyangensis]MCP9764697.1 GNAT family N-acetyltransferase [Lacihabitans soyangensis]
MIRAANIKDLESVKLLVEELEEQVFDFEVFRGIFDRNLQDKNVHYFVAEVDSSVVGFMSLFESTPLHHCYKIAELQELIINHKYRGLHIGEAFIKVAFELGVINNWTQIELSSHMKRLKAHSFYMRNGLTRRHFKFVKTLK